MHIVGLRVVTVDLGRVCSVAQPFVVRVQCLRDVPTGGGEVVDWGYRGYRTLRVAGGVTFWLSGAGKSVF